MPIDEGHEAQHDVVMMRSGMIDDLVFKEPGATPEFAFNGCDDLLHLFEAEVRDASTTRVVLQIVYRQLVGITVEDFT